MDVKNGIRTIDEIRGSRGLDAIGIDYPLVPMSQIPITMAGSMQEQQQAERIAAAVKGKIRR